MPVSAPNATTATVHDMPAPIDGRRVPRTMKAVQVRAFGGLDAMVCSDLPVPVPGAGQLLVRVFAAGVGNWDALVREGRSALKQPLPLVLGSDLSGVVVAIGADVTGVAVGDAVYGVTNARFVGAYAGFAVADAAMIAAKPKRLSHAEAASVPVVAVTAWQMLFDRARMEAGQRVLVLGGAGNVGGYAVQLAAWKGGVVTATASADQAALVQSLGAGQVADARTGALDALGRSFDVVIDAVGGATQDRALDLVRPGGIIVSAVAAPDPDHVARCGVRADDILVSVTTAVLQDLAALIDAGRLTVRVGEVLPLSQARTAHEMLAGRPHKPGKIVLLPPDDGVPRTGATTDEGTRHAP